MEGGCLLLDAERWVFVPSFVHSFTIQPRWRTLQLEGVGGEWPWQRGASRWREWKGHRVSVRATLGGTVPLESPRGGLTLSLPNCRTHCPIFLHKTLQWLVFAPVSGSGLFVPHVASVTPPPSSLGPRRPCTWCTRSLTLPAFLSHRFCPFPAGPGSHTPLDVSPRWVGASALLPCPLWFSRLSQLS